jgi:hypothetical protein
MPEAYKPIDISNDLELLKLAEEVHTTHEPRILRRDDEDLAVLIATRYAVARKTAPCRQRAQSSPVLP